MVGILAFEVIDVERDFGVVGKPTEKLTKKIHVKTAHLGARPFDLTEQTRATGKVHNDPAQRLIKRDIAVTIARNAAFIADGLFKGHSKGDSNILNRVVVINVDIPLRLDLQINQPMAGNLIQHVVKKRNARL